MAYQQATKKAGASFNQAIAEALCDSDPSCELRITGAVLNAVASTALAEVLMTCHHLTSKFCCEEINLEWNPLSRNVYEGHSLGIPGVAPSLVPSEDACTVTSLKQALASPAERESGQDFHVDHVSVPRHFSQGFGCVLLSKYRCSDEHYHPALQIGR
eukprot:1158883-Pelagomonas_calceolata.AAC.6